MRIGQKLKNDAGVTLLLYKDSRVDMDILDETVGAMNWQRTHFRDNANCTVEIWDEDKKMWVSKEDTGTESNTEKEKGLASDSFKRACVNWGIGRELYTAPKITIWGNAEELKKDSFKVKEIGYNDKREIAQLKIVNSKDEVVYEFPKTSKTNSNYTKSNSEKNQQNNKEISESQRKRLFALANGDNDKIKEVITKFGYESTAKILTSDYEAICGLIQK